MTVHAGPDKHSRTVNDRKMAGSGKLFVGGNWKLNCSKKQAEEVIGFLKSGKLSSNAGKRPPALYTVNSSDSSTSTSLGTTVALRFVILVEIVVAPPALYLDYVKSRLPQNVLVAAQNCYKEASGAFTGEIRCVNILGKAKLVPATADFDTNCVYLFMKSQLIWNG